MELPSLDAGVGAQVQKRVRAAVQERRRGVTHELRRRARRCSRLGSPSRGERGRHQASHARRCCTVAAYSAFAVLLQCSSCCNRRKFRHRVQDQAPVGYYCRLVYTISTQ